MQRRHFSLSLIAGLSATTGLASLPALAQVKPVTLKENENFWAVSPAQPNNVPEGKVLVLEFFAYSCSYCYQFMPAFEAWAKNGAPKEAHVQRIPVSFREIVEPHARLYYTLEALNRLDLHDAAFKAVLVERKSLISVKEISAFFAANGVNTDEAMGVYDSFGIQAKVKQANQIVKAYDIQGTPAMGIGGQYRLSGANKDNFALANQLIARIVDSTPKA